MRNRERETIIGRHTDKHQETKTKTERHREKETKRSRRTGVKPYQPRRERIPAPKSCLAPQTLTTACLCPPVLDDNASSLTGSSIRSQRLAKYALGPIAQAEIQNAAPEETIRWHMGMAVSKGASHASGQGSTEARAPVLLQPILRTGWAGPVTFIPAQWVPAWDSPAAAPDGYGGSQGAVREDLVVAGVLVHVPAEPTYRTMIATGQRHLHSPVPVIGDPQAEVGCQHHF